MKRMHMLRLIPYCWVPALLLLASTVQAADRTVDSLLLVLKNAAVEHRGATYRKLASYYFQREDMSPAFEYAQLAMRSAREQHDDPGMAKANNLLGYIYLYWDNYQSSLDAFLSAERLSQGKEGEETRVVALHGLARNYAYLKDIDKALAYNRKGIALARKNDWKSKVNGFANTASNIFNELKQYDSSLFYLNLYLELSRELQDLRSEVFALNNIGEHYLLIKDYTLAMHYLDQAEKANATLGDFQARAAVLGNKALIFKGRGEYEKAIDFFGQSNRIALEKGLKRFAMDNFKSIAEVYEEMGEPEKALRSLRKYIDTREELFGEERQRGISELARSYEQSEQKRQEELLLQRQRNERTLLYLSLAVTLLAIITIFLMINGYRLKLKLHQQRSLEMSEAMDRKNRELTSALMFSGRIREGMARLGDAIRHYERGRAGMADVDSALEPLKGLVDDTQGFGDEWENMLRHFNEIHPGFFIRLQERGPELTPHDLKHCAYIRMNLSTKEIGRMLNISERSVQTARYRIKKKLNLVQDTDLISFLQNY